MSTSTRLHEALSRLHSGDLPAAEEAALRARIAREPEVAAAWAAMQRALADLDRLPDIPPPPGLDARILARPAPPRRRERSMAAAAGLALAAAALLWIAHPAPPEDEIVLLEGRQWLEGDLLMLAGDAVVEVDGRVEISVEPPGGGSRAIPSPTQEADMNRTAILTALAGSAVTVAVYEGTATVRAHEGAEPVVVRAGEQHTTRPDASAGQAAPSPEGPATGGRTAAQVEAELAQAREALRALELENALHRGQLKAHQGEVSDWPAGIPEAYTEAFLSEAVAEQLAGMPDVEVERLDCDEYPCLIAIRSTAEDEGWSQRIQDRLQPMLETHYDDDAHTSINRSVFEHNGHQSRFLIAAVSQEQTTTPEVRERLDYRMDEIIDELGQESAEHAEAHPD